MLAHWLIQLNYSSLPVLQKSSDAICVAVCCHPFTLLYLLYAKNLFAEVISLAIPRRGLYWIVLLFKYFGFILPGRYGRLSSFGATDVHGKTLTSQFMMEPNQVQWNDLGYCQFGCYIPSYICASKALLRYDQVSQRGGGVLGPAQGPGTTRGRTWHGLAFRQGTRWVFL